MTKLDHSSSPADCSPHKHCEQTSKRIERISFREFIFRTNRRGASNRFAKVLFARTINSPRSQIPRLPLKTFYTLREVDARPAMAMKRRRGREPRGPRVHQRCGD